MLGREETCADMEWDIMCTKRRSTYFRVHLDCAFATKDTSCHPTHTSTKAPKDMPSTTTKRASLVQSLKGTSIMIPDLEAMLAHWPSAINMHEDQLRNEVHQRLER
jgi:hypothetical protein